MSKTNKYELKITPSKIKELLSVDILKDYSFKSLKMVKGKGFKYINRLNLDLLDDEVNRFVLVITNPNQKSDLAKGDNHEIIFLYAPGVMDIEYNFTPALDCLNTEYREMEYLEKLLDLRIKTGNQKFSDMVKSNK